MFIQNIKKFIYLIESQITGNPERAAAKLEISNRTLHNYCHLIKNELNAPLAYDKFRETYYFSTEGSLKWHWVEGIEFLSDGYHFKNKRLSSLNDIVNMALAKNTGGSKILASKLKISERNLFYYIDLLRTEFNVPIYFDRQVNSYVIQNRGFLSFRWQIN
jgi:hypothetical protein